MRILVTGAAGFVGSHLCEHLLAEGHEVVGLDAFIESYPRAIKERNLAGMGSHPRFTFHELDLRTDRLEPSLEGVEAVVNEAAMAGLSRSWSEMELYTGCNLLAVRRLVDACRAQGVRRFLQISTSSVYGVEAAGDESILTRPVSPYGVTKLAAEHLVLAYVDAFGFPAAILRYFSIYGPRQRPDMAYHIFIEALRAGRPITVYGDGRQSRSNTFVTDCVRGTVQALGGAETGEVYNIGGGEVITLAEAIEITADALGVRPVVRHEPARPGDQRHTRADTTKARLAFGYRPAVSPREGLRVQVDWHLSGGTRAGAELRPPTPSRRPSPSTTGS